MPASAGCAGTSAAFNWGINSILAEFQRLKDHQGFPNGDQIDCPIFTQDKWNYIQALNDATDGITMPIHKIPISPDMDMAEMRDNVGRYRIQ